MPESLPLVGIRVVSLAINVPGPVAAARLAALGAEVTKVEPPGGDFLAVAAPAWYSTLVAAQRVVTIDLKDAGAHASLETMLDAADVLVVSSRPAALRRPGLRGSRRARGQPALPRVARPPRRRGSRAP